MPPPCRADGSTDAAPIPTDMDTSHLITHIEALIFASEKPLTALDIVT